MKPDSRNKKKVVVGLSGGVDSSVAAALLVAQGYDVTGVFMKNWSEDVGDFCCSWSEDLEDARRVAQMLGIRFYVWNFEKEYKERVIGYFFSEYKAGRTPNPDVMCNREIKFKLFLEKALRFGADAVATGHYARVVEKQGSFRLLRGKDGNKDQSYFLCMLGQEELRHILFPVGAYTKPKIRALAKKYRLPTFDKPDSQGICFIGEVDIKQLLMQQIKPRPGDIVDTEGTKLGRHDGLAFYTLGQRGGLEIGGTGPYYVVAKDQKKNRVVVSNDPNDPLLWRRQCIVRDVTWTRAMEVPERCGVAIRYRHPAYPARIERSGKDGLLISFAEAQRAITPGQLAVFYEKDELLGAGVIDTVV